MNSSLSKENLDPKVGIWENIAFKNEWYNIFTHLLLSLLINYNLAK